MAVARLLKINASGKREVYDKTLDEIEAIRLIAGTNGIITGGNLDMSPNGGTNKFKITNLADGTNPNDGVNYAQLQAISSGVSWQGVVQGGDYIGTRTITEINALTPTKGDTVVAGSAGTPSAGSSSLLAIGDVAEYNGADWIKIITNSGGFVPNGTRLFVSEGVLYSPLADATDENKIAIFDGTSNTPSSFTTPLDGWVVVVGNDLSYRDRQAYQFDTSGTDNWILFPLLTLNEAGDGITISNGVISIDLLDSGSGLTLVGTTPNKELSINFATTFTIDGADALAFKASDIASTTAGKGASIVGVQDSAGIFAGNNVEAVLKELRGKTLTTATVIDVGDLVYYSASNVVSPVPITSGGGDVNAVGIAITADGAGGGTVVVLENDFVLAGVGSGWTVGANVYWNGTALTQTIPVGTGQYVWVCGVAKNATDLDVSVKFSHRNEVN